MLEDIAQGRAAAAEVQGGLETLQGAYEQFKESSELALSGVEFKVGTRAGAGGGGGRRGQAGRVWTTACVPVRACASMHMHTHSSRHLRV